MKFNPLPSLFLFFTFAYCSQNGADLMECEYASSSRIEFWFYEIPKSLPSFDPSSTLRSRLGLKYSYGMDTTEDAEDAIYKFSNGEIYQGYFFNSYVQGYPVHGLEEFSFQLRFPSERDSIGKIDEIDQHVVVNGFDSSRCSWKARVKGLEYN